jgi:predicted transcriptional regulator
LNREQFTNKRILRVSKNTKPASIEELAEGAERDGVNPKSSRRESSPEHKQQKAAMVSRKETIAAFNFLKTVMGDER